MFAWASSVGKWIPARHLLRIDEEITRFLKRCEAQASGQGVGESANILILEAPPRHGKSEFVSKWLPAWYLCRHPGRKVMLASYEANFARTWGKKARSLVAEFGREFDVYVSSETNKANDWEIEDHKGGMATTGVGGPMTGRGANLLIVDDPIKNAEEALSETVRGAHWDWWQSTAYTRIEPGGAAIVMNTRWHQEDLAGRIIRASENGEIPPVTRISLPALAEVGFEDPLSRAEGEALWPERWPSSKLAELRRSMERYWWMALYQQRPTKHASVEWPEEYFSGDIWFDEFPQDCHLRVVALDPSKGRNEHADYSAFVSIGEDPRGVLWVDADMERRPAGRIVADGVKICQQFRPTVFGVEGNAWQDLLGPMFLGEFESVGGDLQFVEIMTLNNQIKKEIRIRRLDPWLRNGRVRFRRNQGTKILVRQLKEFPLADHDDGPDAFEMATRLLAHIREDAGTVPQMVVQGYQ